MGSDQRRKGTASHWRMPVLKLTHSDFAHAPVRRARVHSRRQLHVSDECLSREEFARHQRRSAERDLSDLVWQCWDQYRYAHHLIRPGTILPDWDRRRSVLDLTRLLKPWDDICVTYRRHAFDPQLALFEKQQTRELDRWHAFQQECCLVPVLQDPAFTRCTLENVGVLDRSKGVCLIDLDGMFGCIISNINERYSTYGPTYIRYNGSP